MSLPDFNYTTGPASLRDVGALSYEGCIFSPLFTTNVSGHTVTDNARRTIKYMEYTITADGYVTLHAGASSINPAMVTLRKLLTRQGGALVYQGRGMDLSVNTGGVRDVSWGPVPELLEFQPLGGGRSAKVQWQVKVRIPEVGAGRASVRVGGIALQLLQFNYESTISYGEDGYTVMSERGTMEIPLTRSPSQSTRTVPYTVDSLRSILDARIFDSANMDLFRITKRDFNVSRDKRTMEWSYVLEEKPYMDLPPNCNVARGSFNVRPAKAGMGLAVWLCTLRGSYNVRLDRGRAWAWRNFLALLRLRMEQSQFGSITEEGLRRALNTSSSGRGTGSRTEAARLIFEHTRAGAGISLNKQSPEAKRAWLLDFSIDEGLYLDSKVTSFSATWRLTTRFDHILKASGLWRKVSERDTNAHSARRSARDNNYWAISMRGVLGSKSWTPRKDGVDPAKDIIVDFGSDT
jgi:hypothetical protein